MARPTNFTPELAERICQKIAEGNGIRRIGRLPGFPNWRTIMRWLANQGPEFEAFRQQYARAREARADARFESIDQVLQDLKDKKIDAQAARVMVDAIKWQAGRENGKRYGDAVTIKGDKDNPIETRTRHDLSDAELLALAAGGLCGQD